MTIKECLDMVDNTKPNGYGTDEKVEWLSRLDAKIVNDIINTHEPDDVNNPITATRYNPDNLSHELIVPYPYDELYPAYIGMQIDLYNNETGRYNNSATMFNTMLLDFEKYWNKTHRPINKHQFLI